MGVLGQDATTHSWQWTYEGITKMITSSDADDGLGMPGGHQRPCPIHPYDDIITAISSPGVGGINEGGWGQGF